MEASAVALRDLLARLEAEPAPGDEDGLRGRFGRLAEAFGKRLEEVAGAEARRRRCGLARSLADACTAPEQIDALLDLLARPAPDALKLAVLERLAEREPPLPGAAVAERLVLVPRAPLALAVVGLLERAKDGAAAFALCQVLARRSEDQVADAARKAGARVQDRSAACRSLLALSAGDEPEARPASSRDTLLALLGLPHKGRRRAWSALAGQRRDLERFARSVDEELQERAARSSVKAESWAGRLRDALLELCLVTGETGWPMWSRAQTALTRWANADPPPVELVAELPDHVAGDFFRKVLDEGPRGAEKRFGFVVEALAGRGVVVRTLEEDIERAAEAIGGPGGRRLWEVLYAGTKGRSSKARQALLRLLATDEPEARQGAARALAAAPRGLTGDDLASLPDAACRAFSDAALESCPGELAGLLVDLLRDRAARLSEASLRARAGELSAALKAAGQASASTRLAPEVAELVRGVVEAAETRDEDGRSEYPGRLVRPPDGSDAVLSLAFVSDWIGAHLCELFERHASVRQRWRLLRAATSSEEGELDLAALWEARSGGTEVKAFVEGTALPELTAAAVVAPRELLACLAPDEEPPPLGPWALLAQSLERESAGHESLGRTAGTALPPTVAQALEAAVERASRLLEGNQHLQRLLQEIAAQGTGSPTSAAADLAGAAQPEVGASAGPYPEWYLRVLDAVEADDPVRRALLGGGPLPPVGEWSHAARDGAALLVEQLCRRLHGAGASSPAEGDDPQRLWDGAAPRLARAGLLQVLVAVEGDGGRPWLGRLPPNGVEALVATWLSEAPAESRAELAEQVRALALPPFQSAAVRRATLEALQATGHHPAGARPSEAGSAVFAETVRRVAELGRRAAGGRERVAELEELALRAFAGRAGALFEEAEAAVSGVLQVRAALRECGLLEVEERLGHTVPRFDGERHRATGDEPARRYRARSCGFRLRDGSVVRRALLSPDDETGGGR